MTSSSSLTFKEKNSLLKKIQKYINERISDEELVLKEFSFTWKSDNEMVFYCVTNDESPLWFWEELAEDFPKIKAYGSVIRDDDDQNILGPLEISNGKIHYTQPEDTDEWEEGF